MPFNKYKEENDRCRELLKVEIKSKSKVNPQKEGTTTRIENHILEALIKVDCKCSITKDVILLIMRMTWGFDKLTWTIKFSKIMGALPPTVSEKTVHNAIKEALDHNILVKVESKGRPTTFGINKHFDTWVYDRELKGSYVYIPHTPQDVVKPSVSSVTDDRGVTECTTYDEVQDDLPIECNDGKEYKASDYQFNRFHIKFMEEQKGFINVEDEILWCMSKGVEPSKAFGAIMKKYTGSSKENE